MLARVLSAFLGSAEASHDPLAGPSVGENLALILTKPDNIPIILMIILVGFYTYMAMRDARKHDRLIKAGRKSDILKSMQD